MSGDTAPMPRPDSGLTVLYSGSFNPLHIGHLAILRALCGREDVEQVLLTVSPRNPLKENISEASAQARLQAAREALARHPELGGKVSVCDIEFRLSPPWYTIRTLDALTGKQGGAAPGGQPEQGGAAPDGGQPAADGGTAPDNCTAPDDRKAAGLCLAVGGDQLADFRRWKDYGRILREYGLLVFPRAGYDSTALREDLLREDASYRIILIDAPQVDISSTDIREGLVSDPQSFLM